MKIVLAGDSAGAPLVHVLARHLAAAGHEVREMSGHPEGANELYPEMTQRVTQAILSGEVERGILCCGTGIGVCISANKIAGIRAALTHDTYSAERAAESNNAQIITMGARVIGPELAKAIADTFLRARFDPAGRSAANVAGIDALDRR